MRDVLFNSEYVHVDRVSNYYRAIVAAAAIIFISIYSADSLASDCECVCVDGEVRQVCPTKVAYELAPMCAPAVCPPPAEERLPEPDVNYPDNEWLYTAEPNPEMETRSHSWNTWAKDDSSGYLDFIHDD